MTASADEPGPGYCRSCGEFHLLARVDIPAIGESAFVCANCAARGPELAWRLAGVTEDGTYGYELEPDEFTRTARGMDYMSMTRGPVARRRDRLAESLASDEGRADENGFRVPRAPAAVRVRTAWRQFRGRL